MGRLRLPNTNVILKSSMAATRGNDDMGYDGYEHNGGYFALFVIMVLIFLYL